MCVNIHTAGPTKEQTGANDCQLPSLSKITDKRTGKKICKNV
jgi:hypothetical protein